MLFSRSIMSDSLRPHGLQHRVLSFTFSRSLLKRMSIESVMPSNCLILCRPLLPLPSIFSSIRVFSSELALHIRWPKYWSFSISPSNEYSGENPMVIIKKNTNSQKSKEELKSLLMTVKEESENVGSKFSIQKTKIMAIYTQHG